MINFFFLDSFFFKMSLIFRKSLSRLLLTRNIIPNYAFFSTQNIGEELDNMKLLYKKNQHLLLSKHNNIQFILKNLKNELSDIYPHFLTDMNNKQNASLKYFNSVLHDDNDFKELDRYQRHMFTRKFMLKQNRWNIRYLSEKEKKIFIDIVKKYLREEKEMSEFVCTYKPYPIAIIILSLYYANGWCGYPKDIEKAKQMIKGLEGQKYDEDHVIDNILFRKTNDVYECVITKKIQNIIMNTSLN